jgi:hypothetical protein
MLPVTYALNLFFRESLNHFGPEDSPGGVPFDDLFDAAKRAETFVAPVKEMGRMEKARAGAVCLQDTLREFIGAVN